MTRRQLLQKAKKLGGWEIRNDRLRRLCEEHKRQECPITAVANHRIPTALYLDIGRRIAVDADEQAEQMLRTWT